MTLKFDFRKISGSVAANTPIYINFSGTERQESCFQDLTDDKMNISKYVRAFKRIGRL